MVYPYHNLLYWADLFVSVDKAYWKLLQVFFGLFDLYLHLSLFWYLLHSNYSVYFLFTMCVPSHQSAVPARYAHIIMGLIHKIDRSKITHKSHKTEDMWSTILSSRFFGSWYNCKFGGYKFFFFIWCLPIWVFPDSVLCIYPIWTKMTFFLITLDGQASILRPKQPMNFLHSVLYTIKMGS